MFPGLQPQPSVLVAQEGRVDQANNSFQGLLLFREQLVTLDKSTNGCCKFPISIS